VCVYVRVCVNVCVQECAGRDGTSRSSCVNVYIYACVCACVCKRVPDSAVEMGFEV